MEDENFGSHCLGKVRTFLWNLMEYPETSRYAQVVLLRTYYWEFTYLIINLRHT